MFGTLIGIGVVALIFILLNLKTSRPDGKLINKYSMHAYRTMLGYIMPTRNGSVVYFDSFVRAEKLLEYIEKARARHDIGLIHCIMAAVTATSRRNPKMNTFISGLRLYQRNNWYVSFSMKRKKMDKEAKVSAVKLKLDETETFNDLVKRMNGDIDVERSDAETYADKETGLLIKLPRPLLRIAVAFVRWVDYYNLLPKSFIDGDAFYSTIVCANLGSLGMGAAFHHLYEWGNCPLFLMVGKAEDRAVVEDGEVVVRKILHLRWSYDERIDDGLTARGGLNGVKNSLENPFETFGCLEEDGSDVVTLDGWDGIDQPDATPPQRSLGS